MQSSSTELLTFCLETLADYFNQNHPEITKEVTINRETNTITIATMEEDTLILTHMWKCLAYKDCDIYEFTMHSKMIEDGDENFITTLTITLIEVRN